ncbi:MAG TPA: AraC family transcriptional regulator [Dongiaceae bacterium]|nr:AraC family transcriptional regulator [Dongiaceae bacterium]
MVDSALAALDRGGAHVIYASLLADLLSDRGISTDALLHGTGIAPADLKSIDGHLSTRQYIALIRNARRLDPDPALSFAYGLHLKLSTHGFLGFAAMSASTLGEALELAMKYCRTRFEFMRMLYYRQQGFGVVEIDEAMPMGEAYPFMLEAFMTSFAVMSMNLLGEIPSDIQVRRTGDKPVHFDDAMHYFQQQHSVRFNDSVNQILIPEAHLQRRLVLSDPVARQLAEAQCEKELQTIQVRDDLVYRVTRLLKDFEGAWPKLDQVAAQLHVSPRTLKRRLLEANTSFQVLLDQVRLEQARLLLSETRKSVDAIAATLGYSDTSNFNRAFRRWLGVTPAAYRREQQRPHSVQSPSPQLQPQQED